MQSKVIAKSGGGTQFLDLVTGWENYKKSNPEVEEEMKKSHLLGEQSKIDQILSKFKQFFTSEITGQSIEQTQHPLLAYNERLGQELLYIGISKTKFTGLHNPLKIKVKDIIKEIEKTDALFHNTWEQGDLVIWDNDQVMHRLAADFKEDWLLFKVTVRQL